MEKLTYNFQNAYKGKNIYDTTVFDRISKSVTIHGEAYDNPLSSAASCLNVLGSMGLQPDVLLDYLNSFGLKIQKLIPFPSGADVGGEVYDDKGYVVFEWIGPKKSTIGEKGGSRGLQRTSIDAYVLAVIDDKITQLIIEWKFTEGKSRPLALERFSGLRGIERLRRYSGILVNMRSKPIFPFNFTEEGGIGLYDLSVDHLYQLLRNTLFAKTTSPITIGEYKIEDYRVVHLTHSQNSDINILHGKYLKNCPGLAQFADQPLHEVWKSILSQYDQERFVGAYWDQGIKNISDPVLKKYLDQRYC